MITSGPNLADRLRTARTACGLSREEAADAAGVSESMIAKSEQGRHSPTVATLGRLARAYATTCTRLLEEADAGDPDLYMVEPRDGPDYDRWLASLGPRQRAEMPTDLRPLLRGGEWLESLWVSGATLAWCQRTPKWIGGSRSPLVIRAKAKVVS